MFYIGERSNPQLSRPYYVAMGKLTKKESKARSNPVYGSMRLTGYSTEAEYAAALESLREEGKTIR